MTNDDAFKAKEAQDILENILWGFCGGYWNNKEKMQRMRKDIEKSVKILDGLTKKYIEEYACTYEIKRFCDENGEVIKDE